MVRKRPEPANIMALRYAFIGAVFPLMGLGACATKPLAVGECQTGSQISSPGNLLGGFQSVSLDRQCDLNRNVRTMVNSPDIGVRTTGMIVAAQNDGRVTGALPVAQEAIANANGTVTCRAGTPAAGSTTVPFRCDTPLIVIQRDAPAPANQ